jgi:pyridoxal phosphate enzyme (YggS family)
MLEKILQDLSFTGAQLVAVSKTKPNEAILELYEKGQLDFGENRVQELLPKYEELPKDIRWHLIGHLQTNKVKYVVPFVHLIHSVDSYKILKEINKQSRKIDRVTDCLLQFKIAEEDTKYGLGWEEAEALFKNPAYQEMKHIRIRGVMGMATFTDDEEQVRREFRQLKGIFDRLKEKYFADREDFREISMGMSDDYRIALEEGSTMVRIGSLLFGARD